MRNQQFYLDRNPICQIRFSLERNSSRFPMALYQSGVLNKSLIWSTRETVMCSFLIVATVERLRLLISLFLWTVFALFWLANDPYHELVITFCAIMETVYDVFVQQWYHFICITDFFGKLILVRKLEIVLKILAMGISTILLSIIKKHSHCLLQTRPSESLDG